MELTYSAASMQGLLRAIKTIALECAKEGVWFQFKAIPKDGVEI